MKLYPKNTSFAGSCVARAPSPLNLIAMLRHGNSARQVKESSYFFEKK
jgi:hypothetical protein